MGNEKTEISRRGFIRIMGGATAAAAIGPHILGSPAAAVSLGVRGSVAREFAAASRATGATFRWWWPAAAVDPAVLIAQLDSVAEAGYRGVEIAAVLGVGGADAGVDYFVDPDVYGYGTPRWIEAVEVVLDHAEKKGLKVDICLGPHWNMAVPGLDVNGPASTKELVYGLQLVSAGGTYSGPVPGPQPKTYQDRTSVDGVVTSVTRVAATTLVGVNAVRCTSTGPGAPVVDVTSTIDLSPNEGGGKVEWTPPDQETWAVIGYWYRGTAMKPDLPFRTLTPLYTDPEARVVDYFSTAGAEAFISYFETLLPQRTRRLLRRAGAAILDDSVEVGFGVARLWTPDFLAEFEKRRGYSLVPYLAVLVLESSDADSATRIQRDVQQTLADLYIDCHLKPFKTFANSLGLDYQAQPYGIPIDIPLASALIDVPEGENFGFTRRGSEDWRLIASGADMVGKTVISDEFRPGAGLPVVAYESTQRDLVEQANEQFEFGVTRMRIIGLPYPNWPPSADGSVTDDYTRWPGFYPLPARIPEAFGARNPTWTMVKDIGGYFTRTQFVLQRGVRRTDVAVYSQSLDHMAPADIFDSAPLRLAGYTYGYLTPGALTLPTARVSGRRLAPRGPAYKALVIDNQESMPLSVARQLDTFAAQGLPIVVVGAPPARIPGYAATAAQAANLDAKLEETIVRLLSRANVRRAATAAHVPVALQALDVAPNASSTAPSVRTVRRVDAKLEYYYLYNASTDPVSAEVSVTGHRGWIPYRLDAWTGSVTPIPEYTRSGERYEIELELGRRESAIVVIAPRGWVDGSPFVRASAMGVGRAQASKLPNVVELGTWDLRVDDWLPAGPGQPSSHMNHAEWSFPSVTLKPWSEFPNIANASGIGTYTTSVTLPKDWEAVSGVYLELGAVNGSYRVRVDGRLVGVANQLSTTVDLGAHLTPLESNKIEVEVATTLINRLRVTRQPYANRVRQAYGLLGPVTLVPYLDVPRGSS